MADAPNKYTFKAISPDNLKVTEFEFEIEIPKKIRDAAQKASQEIPPIVSENSANGFLGRVRFLFNKIRNWLFSPTRSDTQRVIILAAIVIFFIVFVIFPLGLGLFEVLSSDKNIVKSRMEESIRSSGQKPFEVKSLAERKKMAEEEKRKQEEVRIKAEQEAKVKAKEEQRKKAEEERLKEEARIKAEQEAKIIAENYLKFLCESAIDDESPETRLNAIKTLGSVGKTEDFVLEALSKAAIEDYTHSYLGIRDNSVEAVEILISRGQPALKYLSIVAAYTGTESVRMKAIKALGEIGKAEDYVLEGLSKAAIDRYGVKFQKNAIDAVKILRNKGKPALEYLRRVAKESDDDSVRSLAVSAIGEIIGERAKKAQED